MRAPLGVGLRLEAHVSSMDSCDLAMVIHALFQKSRLDYCNVFYVRLPLKGFQKHPLLQNAVVRLLSGAWIQGLCDPCADRPVLAACLFVVLLSFQYQVKTF